MFGRNYHNTDIGVLQTKFTDQYNSSMLKVINCIFQELNSLKFNEKKYCIKQCRYDFVEWVSDALSLYRRFVQPVTSE